MAYRDIILADSPLHYWPMDEASGTSLAALAGSTALNITGATVAQAGQVDGTAVLFDGTDDYAVSAVNLDFSARNKLVVEYLFYMSSVTDDSGILFEHGGYPKNPFIIPRANDPAGLYYTGHCGNSTPSTVSGAGFARPASGAWHHGVAVFDRSLSEREVRVYINGRPGTVQNRNFDEDQTDLFSSGLMYLMARTGSTLFNPGRLQHVAIYANLTDAQIFAHAQAAGVNNDEFRVHTNLWNNGYEPPYDVRASAGSFVRFTTDATSLNVTGSTSLFGAYPEWTRLGLRIDGVVQAPLEFAALGQEVFDVALGGGTKTVEIINGLQSDQPTAVKGSYLDGIEAVGGTFCTPVTPSAENRLVVYGNSISVGASATNPETEGMAALLRLQYGRNVMSEGWGGRSLHDDAVDGTARQAFADRIAGYAPSDLWMCIGTNDYGLNKWTAANFGTAYADLLDKLHAAAPEMRIWCQTPLLRAVETANVSGSTTGDYRTQIATAVSTRTAYATLVDGTEIMTTGDLADGVHPDDDGHAIWAAFIDDALPALVTDGGAPPGRRLLLMAGGGTRTRKRRRR